jgi:DNA-binding XRE family transcriptional regulator
MNNKQLQEYRLSLSLTRGQMAIYMGVTAQTYCQWERGDRRIVAATQQLISVLTQVRMVCPVVHNALIEQAIQVKSESNTKGSHG